MLERLPRDFLPIDTEGRPGSVRFVYILWSCVDCRWTVLVATEALERAARRATGKALVAAGYGFGIKLIWAWGL
jgi:hypothetical protein